MVRVEQISRGPTLKGILPESLVTVVDTKWHGSSVIQLTHKDTEGHLGHEAL